MQTWEWGEFQAKLGRPVYRYLVRAGTEWRAVVTLIEHKLILGFSYGYAPRGPVIAGDCLEEEPLLEIFKTIRTFIIKHHPHWLFARLEPPINKLESVFRHHNFYLPKYYVQPRFNHLIDLSPTETEILARFHASTRSNVNRAERRGVSVRIENHRQRQNCYEDFLSLSADTVKRNDGRQIYPGETYFRSLFEILPASSEASTQAPALSLLTLYGYHENRLAAIHFVFGFGETATYIYGASSTDHLSSKITTYLHWQAMKQAKRYGFKYYDLGAVDERRWPTLTEFKRQSRGQETAYLGNIDIPLNPRLYKWYNRFRRWRHH